MRYLLTYLRAMAAAALLLAAAPSVLAAEIQTRAYKNYGRIQFTFSSATTLSTGGGGTSVTLRFSQPLKDSPASIAASLPEYVTSARVSADGRTLTLSLSKPFQVRQFVSGSRVGIDLVGEVDGTEKPAAAVKPAERSPTDTQILTTKKKLETPPSNTPPDTKKKPAKASETKEKETLKQTISTTKNPVVPPPKPAVTRKEERISKPAAAQVAPAAGVTPPPARKEPATPIEIKPTPAEVATPAAEDKILSTRDQPVAVVEQPSTILSTKPEAAPSPTPTGAAPEKATHVENTKPELAIEPSSPTTPSSEATKTAASPVPENSPQKATAQPADHGPFLVTARTSASGTTFNFPWKDRTAAAVFKRARDIWIIFSQNREVNLKLLRGLMPKQVVSVTQYAARGNMILRITTDGSIAATANASSSGYDWFVTFAPTAGRAALDTPLATDSLEDGMRLVFSVFDTAPPLRFFDPSIGDEMIIIPTFENGRGIATERSFPELTVAEASQGIIIYAKRPNLGISQTRIGLILSSKGGLAVSDTLPQIAGPTPGTTSTAGVMMPYSQWFVPTEKFRDTLMERLSNIAGATKDSKADTLMDLAKLYLVNGSCYDGLGVLQLIETQFPEYYTANRLRLISGACHVLLHHFKEASADLIAPELAEMQEAALWREVLALEPIPTDIAAAIQKEITKHSANTGDDSAANVAPSANLESRSEADTVADKPPPAANPIFQFLKYNKAYIRFYPPHFRQELAKRAANAYLKDEQEEKALAVYDTLVRDGILEPVALEAEFVLGRVAEKKKKDKEALEIYDRLSKQHENRFIAIKARFAAIKYRLALGKINAEEAAERIENVRQSWHGDALEREMLDTLVEVYTDLKRFDEVLRTQKTILEGFPEDPKTLQISAEMADLFQRVFLHGLADDMPPLKALALFYEFRDLTPLGENGDMIIQKLADRLAALDLLDRATQLLDNQIKFRTSAETRSHVGARLALLYLLNREPQAALTVLETTNYGGNRPELVVQRQQLSAQSLLKLQKYDEALAVLFNDTTAPGQILKLDILWAMEDWSNVSNQAEDILNGRPNLTDPLSTSETEVLLKLALAYIFQGDYTQLRYLRDYYSGLIPDSAYKQIFEFVTNDTAPLDPEDFTLVARQISRTEGFLDAFKKKIAEGKLSEAIP